ncbi:MAG: hypothetical protein ACLPLR_03970 [Terriglobales bacterium]
MTTRVARWWSERGFSCISLAVSFVELAVIWGSFALVQTPGRHNLHFFLKLSSIAFMAGTLGSFAFAIAGLVADSHRMTVFVATVAALMTFFICGLPLLIV